MLAAMVHDHVSAIRQALDAAGIRSRSPEAPNARAAADWRQSASALYTRLSDLSAHNEQPGQSEILAALLADLASLDARFRTH